MNMIPVWSRVTVAMAYCVFYSLIFLGALMTAVGSRIESLTERSWIMVGVVSVVYSLASLSVFARFRKLCPSVLPSLGRKSRLFLLNLIANGGLSLLIIISICLIHEVHPIAVAPDRGYFSSNPPGWGMIAIFIAAATASNFFTKRVMSRNV